jgi:hypothetical protein
MKLKSKLNNQGRVDVHLCLTSKCPQTHAAFLCSQWRILHHLQVPGFSVICKPTTDKIRHQVSYVNPCFAVADPTFGWSSIASHIVILSFGWQLVRASKSSSLFFSVFTQVSYIRYKVKAIQQCKHFVVKNAGTHTFGGVTTIAGLPRVRRGAKGADGCNRAWEGAMGQG